MKFLSLLLAILLSLHTTAQEIPRQTVKGTVTDRHTNQPLSGVQITITSASLNAVTDANGTFRIAGVPVGRHTVKAQLMGYETSLLQSIEVIAGREAVLEIPLAETVVTLKDVTVTAQRRQDAINPMAQVSTRQLNVEEAIRFAGTRNDPSRMAQNYAGVSGSNDASNEIIIRGNSPQGVLWRMEGVDIPNPNHFGAFGATGGPVTMLNINTLRSSDFMTGAFPASYGNALAGAFDLRMRNGNKDEYEFLAQLGFNGIEVAAEGPIGKPGNASFLVDYRYSLPAMMKTLGVDVGTGTNIPYYQDLNFKVNLPTKKAGTFSIFAIGGLNKIHFKAGEDSTGLYSDGDTEGKYENKTGVVGITHRYNISPNTFSRAFAAVSLGQNTATDWEVEDSKPTDISAQVDYKLIRTSIGYQLDHRFSSRNQLSGGVTGERMQLKLSQQKIPDGGTQLTTFLNTNKSTGFVRGWLNWQHHFSQQLTANTGVYAQHFLLNGTTNVEPRFNLRYNAASGHAFSFGAGLHSQLQPMEVYFYETAGQLTNKDLAATQALHAVLGYDVRLGSKMRLKLETYYQHMIDAPVERQPSSFSLLNLGAAQFGEPGRSNLINDGAGRNYGAELTLEKFLDKGFYFLFTQSVFSSKYQGSDKVWRNTAFNGQYVTNFLIGKEWVIKPGFSVGADSKVAYAGGQWYTPFDVQATIQNGYTTYQQDKAFTERNNDYLRLDLKLSFTWDIKKMTHKFFVDLQNLTGRKNIYTRRINETTGVITDVNQIGFWPNFNYQFIF